MKQLKKAGALVLCAALVFSTIQSPVALKDVKADTDPESWQESAIIAPEEGQLIGAGYIDVEFDNSMEGYTYTVYLDDEPMYWIDDNIVKTEIGEEVTDDAKIKTFTSDDEGVTEVYTNEVSAHEIKVVADNGVDTYESLSTFYVSKKGMALGTDMTDKISLSKLNCSWYYSWGTDAFNNSVDEGVQHVPMMWGDGEDSIEEMENLDTTSNYIMGFNEPDIASQANMYEFDAIDVWNEYIAPLDMRKVSPGPAAPGGDSGWLKSFMNGVYKCLNPFDTTSWGLYSDYSGNPIAEESKTWVDGVGDDVDAVSLHYYRNIISLDGLKSAVETLWETYHKPIWITEMSLFGQKKYEDKDFSYENEEHRKEIEQFVQDAVEYLDDVPYVERYCWFSYDIDSTNDIDSYDGSGGTAMFEYATGLYTDLGRIYSSIGNPEGYDAQTISDDEMFVYVPKEEEETTEDETEAEDESVDVSKEDSETTIAPVSDSGAVAISSTATEKASVNIPSKAKIKKAVNSSKKSVKLTWKKVSGASKYEVQYAANKKFTKKVKTKTTSKTTIKINKLTKKKKYFFRVRAVNATGCGKWSAVKKVKIKK